MRLLLASRSPRRQELLAAAGFAFDVETVDVDERPVGDESPETYVERLARWKAAAVAARHPDRAVLGADTAVVIDGEILGKPADAGDAARMLRQLSGRSHDVLTGVALAWQGRLHTRVERTHVWMDALDEDVIGAYIRTGEPFDKAGSYAIQGRAARYIPRIDGSFANVVGLPVATVVHLLTTAGISFEG